VLDIVIHRILRNANVTTAATYYIKTAAVDVRSAMAKLEQVVPETSTTPNLKIVLRFGTPTGH